MPGIVRKLVVFAAVDGLVLQGVTPHNHAPAPRQAIKIDYKGNVGPLLKDRPDDDNASVSFEAHGIVGKSPITRAMPALATAAKHQD